MLVFSENTSDNGEKVQSMPISESKAEVNTSCVLHFTLVLQY